MNSFDYFQEMYGLENKEAFKTTSTMLDLFRRLEKEPDGYLGINSFSFLFFLILFLFLSSVLFILFPFYSFRSSCVWLGQFFLLCSDSLNVILAVSSSSLPAPPQYSIYIFSEFIDSDLSTIVDIYFVLNWFEETIQYNNKVKWIWVSE